MLILLMNNQSALGTVGHATNLLRTEWVVRLPAGDSDKALVILTADHPRKR